MFWLATTPTPARTWAQRAATAGEEDAITMPNWPVLAQRAIREKVMVVSLWGPDQSGITAVPSISTSQLGRAKADTTSPVDTGCTPLMYAPIVV